MKKVFILCAAVLGLAACGNANKKGNDTQEKVEDAVEAVAKDAKKATDKAVEEVSKAAKETEEAVKEEATEAKNLLEEKAN